MLEDTERANGAGVAGVPASGAGSIREHAAIKLINALRAGTGYVLVTGESGLAAARLFEDCLLYTSPSPRDS